MTSADMATRKKKTSSRGGSAKAATEDPREPLDPTPKNFETVLAEFQSGLERLSPPEEPQQTDFVAPLIHAHFIAGLPCGYGQEVRRRIGTELVDLNEFRVTEAYEFERMLADLEIPDLFTRCLALQQAVQQVYNDQNSVSLEYLREASVSERKNFFQRIPAISADVASFLNRYADMDEILISPRATTRVQQRLGWDPKAKGVESFVETARGLVAAFGHLPLDVGPDPKNRRPVLEPYLSPGCILLRLAGKK